MAAAQARDGRGSRPEHGAFTGFQRGRLRAQPLPEPRRGALDASLVGAVDADEGQARERRIAEYAAARARQP